MTISLVDAVAIIIFVAGLAAAAGWGRRAAAQTAITPARAMDAPPEVLAASGWRSDIIEVVTILCSRCRRLEACRSGAIGLPRCQAVELARTAEPDSVLVSACPLVSLKG